MSRLGATGRWASILARALLLWIGVALVFWLGTLVVDGFDQHSFEAALLATGLITVLNAILWPLVIRVLLPLTVISFGLGSLLLNAAIVSLALTIVDGHAPDFALALGAAFLLSLALMLLAPDPQPRRRRPPAADRPPPGPARP